MTLIQTVWTPDRVIQVSDRRLTAGPKLIDDYYTKAVVWNDRFTVGFTGMARVDRWQRESTTRWMADIIADCPVIDMALERVQTEAQKRWKRMHKQWDKRTTFVFAGFDPRIEDGSVVFCVTNHDHPNTNVSSDETKFGVYQIKPPPKNTTGVFMAGASLNEQQQELSTRYLRRELKKGDGVNHAVRLMVKVQRNVAQTDKKKTVGMDALCVHIPRNGNPNMPGPTVMSNLGGPDLPSGCPSFGYFDRNGWQWKQEAPLMAGWGQVTQTWAEADPDFPDNQTVGMRILKMPNQPSVPNRA